MRGGWAIGVVVLVLAIVAGPAYAAGSVTLGSGQIEGDTWSASVSGSSGRQGRDRPCVGVTTKYFNGGGSSATCTFSHGLTPEGGVLLATSSEPDRPGIPTVMTGVVMVLAPVAAEVKATHGDGTAETIGLKRLTSAQAVAGNLRRLRYAAFATAGRWCVARLESFGRGGDRLWRSEDLRKRTCSPGA